MDDGLRIEGLTVSYRQGRGWAAAVREFGLRIGGGETYGLVGESGSGKTTVALSVVRYLGPEGRVDAGKILFGGRDLLALSRREMRAVWGKEIGFVPQDPLSALNPSLTIGEQVAEGLRQSLALPRAELQVRVHSLLEMVRIAGAERVAASYPHQISGGMQQRVMIAMALSSDPRLLILDEPTTALDATTQAAILDLFRDLMQQRETAALYVSHNLGVVAQMCDRVAVLYAGELVEDAPVRDLFKQPLHPYTQGLIDSVPRLGQNRREVQLAAIPGQIPALGRRPPACIYADRCPLAIAICHEQRPALEQATSERTVRCHRWPEIAAGEINARMALQPVRSPRDVAAKTAAEEETLLELRDLSVSFELRRSLREVVQGQAPHMLHAVDGVDLQMARARTLGLVGESGSGKTTLARAVVGLQRLSGGEMRLLGAQLPSGLGRRTPELLRQLQIVFQNPEEALNPHRTVGQMLRRPLQRLRGLSRVEADQEVVRLLADVRCAPDYAGRLPRQLSGGEKQRVALARAFAANPELLLCDEPVSALDVSVQASILTLLGALQDERDSAVLFISHDLAVVAYLADRVAVMYAGQLMEVSAAQTLFQPPSHPYTEALLSAIPLIDPDGQQEQIRLEGEAPLPTDELSGCPFHTRCPRFLGDICVQQKPPWRVGEGGDRIYCHIPLHDLQRDQQIPFHFSEELRRS